MTAAIDYPIPSYAAYVWMDDAGDLRLLLPGPTGKAHVLRYPSAKCQFDDKAWTAGWAAMTSVLKDRSRNGEPKKIGNPGDITQAQLAEMMKGMEITMVGKRDAPANLSLEELGL